MEGEQREVIDVRPQSAIMRSDPGTRAEVDLQVSTAKAFPRQLKRVISEAVTMATITQEAAESCIYSYRRGGKDITGPSVRLAEIMACAWGNLRCQTRIGDESHDSVTAVGTAWDMQNNVLIQAECRRSIIDRDGNRYSPDMIAVTQNAAASIALRNAILRVIPKAHANEVYDKARLAAVGDMKSIAELRKNALAKFGAMGVSPERVLARLQVSDEREITIDHLTVLAGIRASIREGERMLEDEFPEPDDAKPKAPAAPQPSPDPRSAPSKLDAMTEKLKGRKGSQVKTAIASPGPGDVAGPVAPKPPEGVPPAGDADGVVRGA